LREALEAKEKKHDDEDYEEFRDANRPCEKRQDVLVMHQ